MLRIIVVKLLAKNLVSVWESSIVDEMSDGISKVDRAKSKNMVIPDFPAKFKLLVETSFRLDFLISEARLIFVKLRQVFIEIPAFHYFYPEYYICVEINALLLKSIWDYGT